MLSRVTDASVWHEYYDAFSYMDFEEVREFCHPRRFLHKNGADRAIVLVHGLTDSPYALLAIGDYFFQKLGYDVYLPLLQCHGLKDADGMRGVQLSSWKGNVQFAIDSALKNGQRLSMGGLSTGGALAFHFISQDQRIGGELYLFSAAFGLYGGEKHKFAHVLEGLLKQPFIPLMHSGFSLLDENPYRYSRVPVIAARELVFLMDENRILLEEVMTSKDYDTKVFSAWSEADTVVRVDVLGEFDSILPKGKFTSFIIPQPEEVSHASVVLAEPVYSVEAEPDDPPLELANPQFIPMMAALEEFEKFASTGDTVESVDSPG